MQVGSLLRLFMLAVTLASTAACSLLDRSEMFRDRQGDYLNSPVVPPMRVPDELDSFTLQEMLPVPPADSVEGGAFITPPPPQEPDVRVREGVVIQRFGDRSWIVLGATPGQVWPRLRDFWTTSQLPVASENAVQGIVETEWLDTDAGVREKYRVRIEPGLHAGNSEIYVVQMSENRLGNTAPAELEESHDPARESQMLSAISVYLADRTDLYRATSVSLLAGSIAVESKARVIRGSEGELQLELRIDYERAWGQVGQSLNTAEVQITDSSQADGVLQVLFAGAEPEERPGFFRRLFTRNQNDAPPTAFAVTLEQQEEELILVTAQAQGSSGELEAQRRDELIQLINNNLN